MAAGVYTIWDIRTSRFIYVGMAGRLGESHPRETLDDGRTIPGPKKTDEELDAEVEGKKTLGQPWGLLPRLQQHANGSRSGDQFCLYVADRIILGTLNETDIREITDGVQSIDKRVMKYVRERYAFRYFVTSNGREAKEIETDIKEGQSAEAKNVHWKFNRPFLNSSDS